MACRGCAWAATKRRAPLLRESAYEVGKAHLLQEVVERWLVQLLRTSTRRFHAPLQVEANTRALRVVGVVCVKAAEVAHELGSARSSGPALDLDLDVVQRRLPRAVAHVAA